MGSKRHIIVWRAHKPFPAKMTTSDPTAAIAWAQTQPDGAQRYQPLVIKAQNIAVSKDTEVLKLLKSAVVTP
jgi:hypothetical protein